MNSFCVLLWLLASPHLEIKLKTLICYPLWVWALLFFPLTEASSAQGVYVIKKEREKKRDSSNGFQLIVEPNRLDIVSTHNWWGLRVSSGEKPQALGTHFLSPAPLPAWSYQLNPCLYTSSKNCEVSWANTTCSHPPAAWTWWVLKWASGSLPWGFWGRDTESGNSPPVRTVKVGSCSTPCVFPLKLSYLHGPGL